MGFIEVGVITYLVVLVFLARKNFKRVSRTIKNQ
jgi:hypothetical protein